MPQMDSLMTVIGVEEEKCLFYCCKMYVSLIDMRCVCMYKKVSCESNVTLLAFYHGRAD